MYTNQPLLVVAGNMDMKFNPHTLATDENTLIEKNAMVSK
jgi:hypothetical protein